ncbi:MAG TPA: G-D-S-L family lipolytic protein [Chitinophagaceae bacterium]|nr:G-D-S-L family lipolytic protein [Chitinophagaceae bacterium]
MKQLLGLCLLAFTLMSFQPPKKKKIIFFGDSITEMAVKYEGYLVKLDSMIQAQGLKDQYELIGSGISGNKVYDLYLRLETDVLEKKPDVVVIYIGVNDIWHKKLNGTGTDFWKFTKFYEALIAKLQAANIQVVLCTPAVIGERTDFSNEMDGDMNFYSNWIRYHAAQKKFPLADIRMAFLEYNLANNKQNLDQGILTTDKVHLNQEGARVVAATMWTAIRQLK